MLCGTVAAVEGVGFEQIGAFLQQANTNKPKGALANAGVQLPIYMNDQLFKADEYKDLIVVYRNGAPPSALSRISDA